MKRFNVLASGNDAAALAAQIEASKPKPKPVKAKAKARPGVTVKGSVVTVDKATVSINEERQGVEIRFPCALPEPIVAKLRGQNFRYCKFAAGSKRKDRAIDKRWYAKHTPEREAFARELADDFNSKVADEGHGHSMATNSPNPDTGNAHEEPETVHLRESGYPDPKPEPIKITAANVKPTVTGSVRKAIPVKQGSMPAWRVALTRRRP